MNCFISSGFFFLCIYLLLFFVFLSFLIKNNIYKKASIKSIKKKETRAIKHETNIPFSSKRKCLVFAAPSGDLNWKEIKRIWSKLLPVPPRIEILIESKPILSWLTFQSPFVVYGIPKHKIQIWTCCRRDLRRIFGLLKELQ